MNTTTTILVVDDDPGVRTLVGLVLKECGADVITASSGPEALLLSDEFPGRIDVVMTDVDMPLMTGMDLARRIQAQRPRVRMLLMSGRQVEGSAYTLLKKPFSPAELISVIAQVCVFREQ